MKLDSHPYTIFSMLNITASQGGDPITPNILKECLEHIMSWRFSSRDTLTYSSPASPSKTCTFYFLILATLNNKTPKYKAVLHMETSL